MNELLTIPNEFTVMVKFDEKSMREVMIYIALVVIAILCIWVLIQKLVKLL